MPSISTSLFAGQQRADTVALRVLKTIDLVIWHRNRHRISRKNVVERSSPNLGHLPPRTPAPYENHPPLRTLVPEPNPNDTLILHPNPNSVFNNSNPSWKHQSQPLILTPSLNRNAKY